ncbi:MAG: PHB depolymerase family esterase [Phycisphaerae bacterium]
MLFLLGGTFGCAVPQPRGDGKLSYLAEPSTRRNYFLYLPRDYVRSDAAALRARRWPTVVSFHGMKPFDTAPAQAREWQQEADRYGFVVVAPELRAPDVLAEFPVRTVHPAFRSDEDATLKILSHVFATTAADPTNVLATSWSSGGYMAHYMVNRHPDVFTALAVRQSNFSSSVLDSAMATRSAGHPIMIFNTQNDFAICRRESEEAVQWYTRHGFRNMGWLIIKNLGHERTPDLAADFFSKVSGVRPNRPANVLVQRQAIDGNAAGLAMLTGGSFASTPAVARNEPRTAALPAAPAPDVSRAATPQYYSPDAAGSSASAAGTPRNTPPNYGAPTPARGTPSRSSDYLGVVVQRVPSDTSYAAPPGIMNAAAGSPLAQHAPPVTYAPAASSPLAQTAPRAAPPVTASRGPSPRGDREPNALSIRVSSAIGIDPLALSFSADCPSDWQRNADFLWTLNGQPIGSSVNGQRTITEPGEHTLGVLVVTHDGKEYRAARMIRVLSRGSAGLVGSGT